MKRRELKKLPGLNFGSFFSWIIYTSEEKLDLDRVAQKKRVIRIGNENIY